MATAQDVKHDFEVLEQQFFDTFGTQAQSRYLHLPHADMNLHVWEIGEGEPVLMIHGGGFLSALWEPLLGTLGQHFHVYAIDRPGCGLSDPFDYTGVDVQAHVVEVLNDVYEVLELGQTHVIGHSYGGYWGLTYAAERPERIEKLVIVGWPFGLKRELPFMMRMMATPRINDLVFAIAAKPTPSNIRRTFSMMMVADVKRVPERVIGFAADAMKLSGSVESFKSLVESTASMGGVRPQYVLEDSLPSINSPTLFLIGDEDVFGSGAEAAALTREMSQASSHIVEGAGHMPWLDQPEICAEAIAQFLGD